MQETRTPMPPVWAGRRRVLLVSLVGLGIAQAVLALVMALSVSALLSPPATPPSLVLALVAAVLGIGVARWCERIVAERLGQDYVYEQRRRLIASAILGQTGTNSLGVAVTRASNDLSAVRNWIAQGIVPPLTGIPLIMIIVVVLAFLDWQVGLAVAVPLALTAAAVPKLSTIAYDRARKLRRHRGRMSAHIADTVRAGDSIRVSGAVTRELNAMDRNSSRVVDAAVHRAWITGLIRALTVTAASLCTVAVVLLSMIGAVEAAGVASVMTLLGVIVTPMSDLGRVVEYRQNYKAARRILAPMLAEAVQLKRAERLREDQWDHHATPQLKDHRGLLVRGLHVEGVLVPTIDAAPGEHVLLTSSHPGRVRAALHELLVSTTYRIENNQFQKTESTSAPLVMVDGIDYLKAPAKQRRHMIGFASQDTPLERGSVRRLISYREPEADTQELRPVLNSVGLAPVIDAEPHGMATKLKNDGLPWAESDVARLKLARALVGTPPVLVVEDIDLTLEKHDVDHLGEILAGYPGVVLLAASRPERLSKRARVWDLDGAVSQDPGVLHTVSRARTTRSMTTDSDDAE